MPSNSTVSHIIYRLTWKITWWLHLTHSASTVTYIKLLLRHTVHWMTKCYDKVVITPSYVEGSWFRSQPTDCISWQVYWRTQMLRHCLKLCHDSFLPHPLKFILRSSNNSIPYNLKHIKVPLNKSHINNHIKLPNLYCQYSMRFTF